MTGFRKLLDRLVRRPATVVNRARKRLRKASGKPRMGAHAIAFTPAGRIVLLKLRYANGWRLPGGGLELGETVIEGALRELQEEIGLLDHGPVRALPQIDRSLVVVEAVTYKPHRWSWEVERIIEADLHDLPEGMSQRARRWLTAYRQLG